MSETETPGLVIIETPTGAAAETLAVLSSLPASFSLPVVIATGGSAENARAMADELADQSPFPVEAVSPRAALRPGTVTVAHVPGTAIEDHAVAVDSSGPPSDRLFATAASTFGEDVISVLLGIGPESINAAYATHKHGGTVIAPANAADGLHALLPYLVDVRVPLEQIGQTLVDIGSGALTITQPDEPEIFRRFVDYLKDRSGVDFGSYKPATIRRRLQRRIVATGRDDLADYMRYMQTHPDEYDQLISSFLIKVTEFFRDPEMYAYLRDHVLPGLIEDARGRDAELRIWSAGTATGEEAYSLAILLTDVLGEELDDVPLRIFATDLDEDAIEFARRGIYPASAVANLPRDMVHRAFIETDGAYEVKKRIRSLIVFGHHDLIERAPFPRIDLLVSRNVLIYFTSPVQRRVLQLFAFSLRNGGYLVLGKAETTSPLPEFFAVENPSDKIYQRRGARTLIPPPQMRDPVPLPTARSVVRSLGGRGVRSPDRTPLAERADRLMQRLPVGVVIVDSHYDIMMINNSARRFLGIHDLALGEDLIHSLRTMQPAPLRQAIDTVVRTREQTTIEVETDGQGAAEGPRSLTITCDPEQVTNGERIDVVMITIVDGTTPRNRIRELEGRLAAEHFDNGRLTDQLNSLTDANQNLVQANEELALSNADLRAGNEELMVGQEELQAAMEEVETLNEELQATNEELETLNEELQATIEELNATNDDLQARTGELQELADSLAMQRRIGEMERTRLELIVSTLGDAVLMVDENGKPIRTNERYDQIFQRSGLVIRGAGGEPIADDQMPAARAARGETFTMPFTIESDGKMEHFEAIGRPVDDQGGMVVIRTIS